MNETLERLNERLQKVSFVYSVLYEDCKGIVWVQEGDRSEPLGTIDQAELYVKSMEEDYRMVAVMS
jgi:hypothetical protein